jgi:hypothetical protein
MSENLKEVIVLLISTAGTVLVAYFNAQSKIVSRRRQDEKDADAEEKSEK